MGPTSVSSTPTRQSNGCGRLLRPSSLGVKLSMCHGPIVSRCSPSPGDRVAIWHVAGVLGFCSSVASGSSAGLTRSVITHLRPSDMQEALRLVDRKLFGNELRKCISGKPIAVVWGRKSVLRCRGASGGRGRTRSPKRGGPTCALEVGRTTSSRALVNGMIYALFRAAASAALPDQEAGRAANGLRKAFL